MCRFVRFLESRSEALRTLMTRMRMTLERGMSLRTHLSTTMRILRLRRKSLKPDSCGGLLMSCVL